MASLQHYTYMFLCLLISPYVICEEDCVTFSFDEGFDIYFDNVLGLCANVAGIWSLRNYSTSAIEAPHPNTDSFITPGETLSCTSSYIFPMSRHGELEVNTFWKSSVMLNQLTILVMELGQNGNPDTTLATGFLSPGSPNFENGWNNLRISLNYWGTDVFLGYVTILGVAAADSIMLVDSFRYIPPELNEDQCVIYRDEENTTTEAYVMTTTTKPEITETTTPEIEMTETTTLEPETIEPTTTEPDITEETTPNVTEQTTLEPDEPTTPDNPEPEATTPKPEKTKPRKPKTQIKVKVKVDVNYVV